MSFEQQLALAQRRTFWAGLRFASAFLILGIGIGLVASAVLS